jgi:hypothetical protein
MRPGDTVWLRGGRYTGSPQNPGAYVVTLLGAPGANIVVRGMPGERAILDGNRATQTKKNISVLDHSHGGYVTYRDFEITNTDPERVIGISGSNLDARCGSAMDISVPGVKVINLLIYDAGAGIGAWSGASDFEAYGCVIWNNGWVAPDRHHGTGLYTQNETGSKVYRNMLLINQASEIGFAGYGSSQSFLHNTHVDNMIHVNNRFLLGGGSPAINGRVTNSVFYGAVPQVGYSQVHAPQDAIFTGNHVLSGFQAAYVHHLNVTDNYFYAGVGYQISVQLPAGTAIADYDYRFDHNHYWRRLRANETEARNIFAQQGAGWKTFAQWQELYSQEPNGTYTGAYASGTTTILYPNEYDGNRAHVAVSNLARLHTVQLEVSSFVRGIRMSSITPLIISVMSSREPTPVPRCLFLCPGTRWPDLSVIGVAQFAHSVRIPSPRLVPLSSL